MDLSINWVLQYYLYQLELSKKGVTEFYKYFKTAIHKCIHIKLDGSISNSLNNRCDCFKYLA